MLDLHELQASFWRAIASAPGNCSAEPALLPIIAASAMLDPEARLQIYVDAYFWRLHGVMQENFTRVAARVGPEEFRSLVADYLCRHPSRHPSIGYVGIGFGDYLAGSGVPPFIADLAHLEWLHALVFESKDGVALTVDALRELSPEEWPTLRFHPVPGLTTVSLSYPVHRLWRDSSAIVDQPEATQLRLWRNADYVVMHSVLDAREAEALDHMTKGEDFATICEAFADLPDEVAAQESIALLVRWMNDGIIAAIETDAS